MSLRRGLFLCVGAISSVPLAILVACQEPRDASGKNRATPATPQPAPTPNPDVAAVSRAIEMTKRSHALKYRRYDLPRGAIDLGGGDPRLTDTEHAVQNEMAHLKGNLRIIGWQAKKIDDQAYLVTYAWDDGTGKRSYVFEVNSAAGYQQARLAEGKARAR